MGTMTTTQAYDHLNDMQTTLGQLDTALDQLTASGNKVKQEWDGKSAQEFQGTWHTYQSNFTQLKADMKKLHDEVTTIHDNIKNAGGGFA